MGKGLALQFKKTYPKNFEHYAKECEKHNVKIGKMCIWWNTEYNLASPFPLDYDQPKYIFNFPTKDHWKDNSELEYIEKGLSDLCKMIDMLHDQLEIKSIAIPAIGSGLGGLNWNIVKKKITDQFKSEHTLSIKVFEPW